jgi:hypothetical protein
MGRGTVFWYPALNLDRALAPSLVGRFSCLTKELVTRLKLRLSVCSGCTATAQARHPLLTLLLRLLAISSPNLSPTLGLSLLLATHALPTSAIPHEFCQLYTKVSGGPV